MAAVFCGLGEGAIGKADFGFEISEYFATPSRFVLNEKASGKHRFYEAKAVVAHTPRTEPVELGFHF